MPLFATTPVEKTTGPYPRRWWALIVLCLSLLIVVMANTSLIVAAPDPETWACPAVTCSGSSTATPSRTPP